MAVGHPDHSGVTIPVKYSMHMLAKYYPKAVLPAISNKDFEGEISQAGDKLVIRIVPDSEVRAYVKGGTITYDILAPTKIDLDIDRAVYWAIGTDLLDKMQSDVPYFEKCVEKQSTQVKTYIDRDVLGEIYADADAANQGANAGAGWDLGSSGAPLVVTKTNILELLTAFASCLNLQDAPQEQRWAVLPDWACRFIKLSELANASFSGDGKSMMRNGKIGDIDTLSIYSSNLLTEVVDSSGKTCTHAIFGCTDALAFASQIVAQEEVTPENTFGKRWRFLQAYGFKVLHAEGLGHAYITADAS